MHQNRWCMVSFRGKKRLLIHPPDRSNPRTLFRLRTSSLRASGRVSSEFETFDALKAAALSTHFNSSLSYFCCAQSDHFSDSFRSPWARSDDKRSKKWSSPWKDCRKPLGLTWGSFGYSSTQCRFALVANSPSRSMFCRLRWIAWGISDSRFCHWALSSFYKSA